MKRSNHILWILATLTLIAARGIAPCWADEPSKAKTSPAAGKKPDERQSVDLRPLFQQWKLDARSQGGRGTCSVFALNAVIEYAVATKQQRGTRLSVEFLNWASNATAGAATDGGCFSKLWAGCAAHAVCPEADMPYADNFDPARKPNKKAIAAAAKIRALGLRLHWIKQWDSSHGASDEQIAEIKRTLRRRWPVCGGFLWPKNEGHWWKSGVLQKCPRRAVMDGHSIVLVGFRDDPTQPGGGVFLIRNSAGPSRDGMMTYDYVRAYLNDAAWIDFPGATKGGPRRQSPKPSPVKLSTPLAELYPDATTVFKDSYSMTVDNREKL
ncbi:MAG: C1 family peptidase [Thermoguttaceae bacterium]